MLLWIAVSALFVLSIWSWARYWKLRCDSVELRDHVFSLNDRLRWVETTAPRVVKIYDDHRMKQCEEALLRLQQRYEELRSEINSTQNRLCQAELSISALNRSIDDLQFNDIHTQSCMYFLKPYVDLQKAKELKAVAEDRLQEYKKRVQEAKTEIGKIEDYL